ncbi:recombinase family protein [Arthrobacter sp. D2-10]
MYLRISQDRTGLKAGVSRQREDCLQRAKERGWEVVSVLEDNDVSAAGKRKRPGFEEMLHLVEMGGAGVVIAWSLDRLQRNRRDEVRLYELCQKHGAKLSLVNGADLDFSTAAGRYVADSLGSVARLEIELKSDRQVAAQNQAAHAGKRVGGRRPFGYDQDGVTVKEDEAAAVKAGYASLLAGVPLAQIARDWNRQGFFTGQAKRTGEPSPWAAYSVRQVLRNPRYMGKRRYNGEIVADAQWPELVDETTWRAADAIFSDPSRRHQPRTTEGYLLSGLAKCGVCGAPSQSGGNARPGVRGYRCSASFGHFARMADPVDAYVAAVVVARLSRPDASDLLHDETKPDIGALRDEAQALRGRLDSLAVEFADGAIDASQLRTGTERARHALQVVEGKMADAGRVNVLGPMIHAEEVQDAWDAAPIARRRGIVDALMQVSIHPPGRGTRTFRPETVQIQWKSS